MSAAATIESFTTVPEGLGLPYERHRLEKMLSTTLLKIVTHDRCPPALVEHIRGMFLERLTSREPHWDEPPAA